MDGGSEVRGQSRVDDSRRRERNCQGGERGIILVDIRTEIQQGVSTSLYRESNVQIWVGGRDGGEIKPELCPQSNTGVVESK